MIRLVILLALVALQSVGSQAPAPPGAPLLIDAVVVDARGMPVMDLKREDLEVWIAGYRVPIDTLTAVNASNERHGRSIVLILDDLTIPLDQMARVRDVARRFVFISGGALTPKMQDFLGAAPNLKVWKPFGAAELLDAIASVLRDRRARA